MTTCRTCNAPIRWARTAQGKAIPLDPEACPLGNLEFIAGDVVRYVQPDANAPGRYRSHFSSCPQASQHRKRRR